ncbi:cupin domain-containing protein [Thalassotalea mangrovi]|uniref:Cupin domain-containing protein n=1 Tax=Thalassotalea mangrovi TaxID=2572245 RepID=A0A4U1B9I5_9GAMM|nr:cupin domain-containing protein [Thalassotalea mangrovi]TKB47427.1 cupin domain-containing protein [Thalassotalea mangrovi]
MLKKQNLFGQIPADLTVEVFDILYQKHGVTIERIVSNGQSSPEQGWYQQSHDEWVIVLQGSASLGFETEDDVQLAAGEHILIPSMMKHKVVTTSSNPPTIWLAVHVNNPAGCCADNADGTAL